MSRLFFLLSILVFFTSHIFSQYASQEVHIHNSTLLDIQFLNENVGYITDDAGRIYWTKNKGEKWDSIIFSYDSSFFNSISIIDEENGWVLSLNKVLKFLRNTRFIWPIERYGIEIGHNLYDIQMINDSLGYIVGSSGQIYKTDSAWRSFDTLNGNTSHNLWSVFFLNDSVGFICGVEEILRTDNGGESWTTVFSKSKYNVTVSFKSVHFSDSLNGWAVGESWDNHNPAIYHTNDGGENWSEQYTGLTGLGLHSVIFVDNQNGYACGGNGTLLRTKDGGNTWKTQKSRTKNYLRSVFAIDTNQVYTVGQGGTLKSTLQPGAYLKSQKDVDEFGFANAKTVIGDLYFFGWDASRNNDTINDISAFIPITEIHGDLSLAGLEHIKNLNGLDSLRYIEGDLHINSADKIENLDELNNLEYVGGSISVTYSDSISSYCGLYELFNSNALGGDFYVHGNLVNPTIDKILNGGPCDTITTDIRLEKLPIEFSLSQNYPNPFNPNTIIKFALPKQSFIKLNIYNSLGEKVVTLINEELVAGYQEIEFTNTSLSSGIYFYRLEAGDFVETKKMILLK